MLKPFVLAAAGALLAAATTSFAEEPSCQITFRIGTTHDLDVATVNPTYVDAPGEFKGESTNVECVALNDNDVSVTDFDSTRGMTITVTGAGFVIEAPVEVLRCTWLPTTRFPVAADFDLSSQLGVLGGQFPVNPEFHISNIDCTGTIETTTTTTTTTSTTTTSLPPGVCGDFDGNGEVKIADALGVLRTAVGLVECDLCLCDLDGSGKNTIADALLTLKLSVGLAPVTDCPAC